MAGAGPARVCFVGDSYVAGTGDPAGLGWVGRLCAAAWRRGNDLSFYNLGIRGETSVMLAARWKHECALRLPDDSPGRLVFMFGINDISERLGVGLRVELEASIAAARTMLHDAARWLPTIWIGPAPANEEMSPMSPMPGVAYDFRNDRLLALNAAYESIARELGIPYLDIANPLTANADYRRSQVEGDKMHCSGEGYAMIADLVDRWPAWHRLLDLTESL